MSAQRLTAFLAGLSPEQLGALLRYENVQVGALILTQVEPTHGAEAVRFTTQRLRNELILRMSALESPHEQALPMLAASIPHWEQVVAGFGGPTGIERCKSLVECLSDELYQSVRDNIQEYDPELMLKVAPLDDRGR